MAQRFFPVSARETDWQVFATSYPNRFVIVVRGFYIMFENRIGSTISWHLEHLTERLERIAMVQRTLPLGHELRPRSAFFDDKHAEFLWHIDYLHDPVQDGTLAPGPGPQVLRTIEEALGDGAVTYADGHTDWFELTERAVSRWSDHYDPDHYDYYPARPWERRAWTL